MPQICRASGFIILLLHGVNFRYTVHITRFVTFQWANFAVVIQKFLISVNCDQPLTSGSDDFGETPKLSV